MFPLHESQYIEEPQTDDFDPLCICGTRELPFVEVDDGWRKGDHTAHCDEQTRAAEQPRNPSPSSLLFCSTAACHCCVDAAFSLPSHESSLPPVNHWKTRTTVACLLGRSEPHSRMYWLE